MRKNHHGAVTFSLVLLICCFISAAESGEILDKPTAEYMPLNNEKSETLSSVSNPGTPASSDDASKGSKSVESLPDSGESTGFTYSRSNEYPDFYEVYPEGRNDLIPVPESVLRSVVNNPHLTDSQRMQVIDSFPSIATATYQQVLGAAYPDASTSYAEPFPTKVFATETGTYFTLSQDNLAEPYVRVSISYGDGTTKEFSVNREMVARLLDNHNLTGTDLLQALENIPFPLPEEARKNFKNLTKDQLLALARSLPEIARQELVKMMEINRRLEAGEYKANRNALNRAGAADATTSPRGANILKQPLPVMPAPLTTKAEESSVTAKQSPLVSSQSSDKEGSLSVYGWALLIVVLLAAGCWVMWRHGFIP